MKIKLLSLLALAFLCSPQSQAKLIKRHKIPNDNNVIKTFITGNPHDKIISSQINVLVWNMYKGKNKSWEKDFKNLSEDKNIIITQEMFLDDKMTNVFETHGDFEYSTATSFFVWGKERTGVATISDTKVLSKEFLRSKAREPVVRTPKVVMVTRHLLANNEVLLVANIHAVNFVSSSSLKNQLNQVADVIREHKGPVIFAGDFNVWTNKKTKILRSLMASVGLIEVEFDKEDDGRMEFNKHKLDYVFYRDLEFVSSDVLGEIKGADHKPLSVEFRLIE